MDLQWEERSSESSLVKRVWRSASEDEGSFLSMASTHWEMVFSRIRGKTRVTLRGPETQVSSAYNLPDAEHFAIQFAPGVFLPATPPSRIMDRCDLQLPAASNSRFWLGSETLELPTYENAECFVSRLVRGGHLEFDPLVAAAARGEPVKMSPRTLERRYLQATGLTQTLIQRINRARHATALLRQGMPILDVVFHAGYYDQPHLTRSLKRYIGQTPAQLLNPHRSERLSFLYNTSEHVSPII